MKQVRLGSRKHSLHLNLLWNESRQKGNPCFKMGEVWGVSVYWPFLGKIYATQFSHIWRSFSQNATRSEEERPFSQVSFRCRSQIPVSVLKIHHMQPSLWHKCRDFYVTLHSGWCKLGKNNTPIRARLIKGLSTRKITNPDWIMICPMDVVIDLTAKGLIKLLMLYSYSKWLK